MRTNHSPHASPLRCSARGSDAAPELIIILTSRHRWFALSYSSFRFVPLEKYFFFSPPRYCHTHYINIVDFARNVYSRRRKRLFPRWLCAGKYKFATQLPRETCAACAVLSVEKFAANPHVGHAEFHVPQTNVALQSKATSEGRGRVWRAVPRPANTRGLIRNSCLHPNR